MIGRLPQARTRTHRVPAEVTNGRVYRRGLALLANSRRTDGDSIVIRGSFAAAGIRSAVPAYSLFAAHSTCRILDALLPKPQPRNNS